MTAPHTCHATGCTVEVPPKKLMCHRHWFALPGKLRAEVMRHYVPGQEKTKTPSDAYLEAARVAIKWLEAKEGRR